MRTPSHRHTVTRSQGHKVTRSGLVILVIPILCGFSFVSDIQNEQGNKLYKKGQVGKAKSSYLAASKADPKSSEISYNLGNAYFKENNFKQALGAYQKSTTPVKEPLFRSKAFYNLGNTAYRAQDLEKAAESYKQALRANPTDKDAKYNLELVLKKLKKDDEPKKDQDKPKDQPKDQPKKDEPKDEPKQDQGGGGGAKGNKEDEGKGDDQGENKEDKKEGGEKGDSEQEKQDQGENKSESGGESEQKDQKPADKSQESGDSKESEKGREEEKEKPAQPQEGQGGQSGEEKKEEQAPGAAEVKPMSEEEARAEQILRALENQEQQVLKFQNDPRNPRQRVQRVSEQDW